MPGQEYRGGEAGTIYCAPYTRRRRNALVFGEFRAGERVIFHTLPRIKTLTGRELNR
jgi:hypothetical protein